MAQSNDPQGGKPAGERIAKVIARSGLCSRREAEALIEERRVSVNGAVIESAALDILPTDAVLVDGKPLSPAEPPRLWRYHKAKGRVTTHKDPEGRPTVFEALPEGLPRLISVGRLDFNTEGLLLLTNDGDLARHLELPSTGWTRRYRVRAFGQVTEAQLKELEAGVTVNKMSYGPIEASLEREQGGNVWISISIREGKNREVRRVMEHLGLTVNRLIRVSFGPFMLGDLEPGRIEEVKTAVLKDQLGPRLSRQLGVRREPLREERRLNPPRGKPTYLRRKPAAAARPEPAQRRDAETRPLKRRRIFEQGAAEAPKIEFVPERTSRKAQFAGAGRSGDKSRRQSRDGEHIGERELEDRRYLERPRRQERDRPAGEWNKTEGAARHDASPGNRDRFAERRDGSPKPDFKHQERRSAFKGERTQGQKESGHWPARRQEEDAPRFKKFGPKRHGEEPRNRRSEGNAEPREWKASPDAPKRGDRPPRPFKTRSESKQDFGGKGGKGPRAKAGGKPFRAGGKRGPQNRPRPHKPEPDKETP